MWQGGGERFRFEGPRELCARYVRPARVLVERTREMFAINSESGADAATRTYNYDSGAWVRVTVFVNSPPIITINVEDVAAADGGGFGPLKDCNIGLAVQSDAKTASALNVLHSHDLFLRADSAIQSYKNSLMALVPLPEVTTPVASNDVSVKTTDTPWISPQTIPDPYGLEFWTLAAPSSNYPTETNVARYIILSRMACFTHLAIDGAVYGGLQDNCGKGPYNACYWPYFDYEVVEGVTNVTRKLYIHTNLREIARRPNGAQSSSDVIRFVASSEKTIDFSEPAYEGEVALPVTQVMNIGISTYYGGQWVICDITKDGKRILLQHVIGSWGMSYGARPNLEYGAVYELTFAVDEANQLNVGVARLFDPNDESDGTSVTSNSVYANTHYHGMSVLELETQQICDTQEPPVCTTYVTKVVLGPGVSSEVAGDLDSPMRFVFSSVQTNLAYYEEGTTQWTAVYDENDSWAPIICRSTNQGSGTKTAPAVSDVTMRGSVTVEFDVTGLGPGETYSNNLERVSVASTFELEAGGSATTNKSHDNTLTVEHGARVINYSFNVGVSDTAAGSNIHKVIPNTSTSGPLLLLERTALSGTETATITQNNTELVDLSALFARIAAPYTREVRNSRTTWWLWSSNINNFMYSCKAKYDGGTATLVNSQSVGFTSSTSLRPDLDPLWPGNYESSMMGYFSPSWTEGFLEYVGSTKQLRYRCYAGAYLDEWGLPYAQQYMVAGPVHDIRDGVVAPATPEIVAGQAMYSDYFTAEALIENMHYAFDCAAYNPVTRQAATNFPYPVSWQGSWPESWTDIANQLAPEYPWYKGGVYGSKFTLTPAVIDYFAWSYTHEPIPPPA